MTQTSLTLPTLDALRKAFCEDMRRLKQRAGVTSPNVAPGSETYMKGEAVASVALQVMAREVALQGATLPDSATGDDLDRLARVWRGLTRSAGAGAQGYVVADCVGTVVYPVGLECRSTTGLRYQVVTTTVAAAGTLVGVRGVDTGRRTDQSAGAVLTWTAPPAGSDVTAEVAIGGLTNGQDADTDARLRQRLLDALRHPASSGAWAHFVEWTEAASAGVEKAFCYPAASGPATVRVAYTVAADASTYYSRAGSVTLTNTVALGVVAQSPEHADVVTTACVDVDTDVVLRLTCPANRADGGAGGTWVDPASYRWPTYVASGGDYATHLSASPLAPDRIRVDCVDAANAPDTTGTLHPHIAVWSNARKEFLHAQVKSATLVAGDVYDLVLYSALDTSALASGDYVSPDMERLDDYATTLAARFAALGPGELTSSADRLPRSYRRPLTSESWPSGFTTSDVGALSTAHPELANVTTILPATLPTYPAVATEVTDPPNILRLGHLALYPA